MKLRAFVVLGYVLYACSGEHGGDATKAGETYPGAEAGLETTTQGQVKSDSQEHGGCGDTCAADAQYDFHVWGEGPSAWEGRRVVAAAIENDWESQGIEGSRRPVLLSSTIEDGEFSLFCPRSLQENYAYPSWAVFIDVDGDGRCTNNDVGYRMQLYGWNADVQEEIPTAGWSSVGSPGALRPTGPPLGSTASDFCAGYFE